MNECNRSACSNSVDKNHYRIWNDPRVNLPNLYCIKCGRKIIEANQNDSIKLKYEIVKA